MRKRILIHTEMQVTRTSLAIDTPTYERVVDLARRNERSTSAEVRVALRRHLERANANTILAASDAADRPAAAGAAGTGAAAGASSPLAAPGRSSARFADRTHEQEPGRGDPD